MKIITCVIGIIVCFCLLYSCHTSFKTTEIFLTSDGNIEHKFIFYEDSTFKYEYKCFPTYKQSSGKWRRKNKEIILKSDMQNKIIPLNVNIHDNSSKIFAGNKIHVNVTTTDSLETIYRCTPYINGETLFPFTTSNSPLIFSERDTLATIQKVNNIVSCFDSDTIYPIHSILPFFNGATIIDVKQGSYRLNIKTPLDSIYFEIWRWSFGNRLQKDPLRTEVTKFDHILGDSINIDINIDESLLYYKVFNNVILQTRAKHLIFYDEEENNINKLYLLPKSKYHLYLDYNF